MKRYKCICCSTKEKPVYVIPTEDKEVFLCCPECGSMELERINSNRILRV